jgi:protein-disulfide isomerase
VPIERLIRLCDKQTGNTGELCVSRSQLIIIGVAIVAVIAAAVAYFVGFNGGQDSAATADSSKPGYEIRADDEAIGSRNAHVVVIEYGAPTCPVCARFNAETIPQFRTHYVDTGKVYYVFRVYPINGEADGAAEGLARCTGTGDSYFHFIDALFRNQKDWDPEYNTPDHPVDTHAGLVKIAALAAGMDQAKADTCMADKANAERINRGAKEAADRYGISGTPTLVINGVVQQPGNMPYSTLQTTLDSFLAKK